MNLRTLQLAKEARDIVAQRLQNPQPVAFSSKDIEWALVTVRNQPDKPVFEAIIPLERVEDFIAGEQLRGPSNFFKAALKKNAPGSLTLPQLFSFLQSQDLWCEYGPADDRVDEPVITDPSSRPKNGKGSYRSRKAAGEGQKRGCQAKFTVQQLYFVPSAVRIFFTSLEHEDKEGKPCHGCKDISAIGTRAQVEARLSVAMKQWVDDLWYYIYGPGTEGALCTCLHAEQGHQCKHVIKLLKMSQAGFSDAAIVRHLGTNCGSAIGGIRRLLSDQAQPSLSSLPAPAIASEAAAAGAENPLPATAADAAQFPQTQQLLSQSQMQVAVLPERSLDKAMEDLLKEARALARADPWMCNHAIAGANKLRQSLRAAAVARQGAEHPATAGPLLPRSGNNTLKRGRGLTERIFGRAKKKVRGTENQPAAKPLLLTRPKPQGKQHKGPSQKMREGVAKELSQKS